MTLYTVITSPDGDPQSIRRDDGVSIPIFGGNRKYQQYLADAAEHGPYPEEIIPDPVLGPTIDERMDALEGAFLDDLLTRL